MNGRDAFLCNVCGAAVTTIPWDALERDHGMCPACNAQVRFRAVAHLIGLELYGVSLPAPAWPPVDKIGYGISDWEGFEPVFRRAFRYHNTQFDREEYSDASFLDPVDLPATMIGTADIVSCSDVLEHIPPPVQRAFDGLFALLKPGGALVVTVPYTFDPTVEHFSRPLRMGVARARRRARAIQPDTRRRGARVHRSPLSRRRGGRARDAHLRPFRAPRALRARRLHQCTRDGGGPSGTRDPLRSVVSADRRTAPGMKAPAAAACFADRDRARSGICVDHVEGRHLQ